MSLRRFRPAMFLAAAVCVLATVAGAQRSAALPDMRDAADWPEALAACDVSRFLLTRPDLNADMIALPDPRTGGFRPTFAPLFLPPTLYGDVEVTNAFYRLQRRRLITREAAVRARAAAARTAVSAYRRHDTRQRLFLEEQDRLCGRVLEEAPR